MVLYEENEKTLRKALAAAIKDSTWLSLLVDDIREEVVDLGERLVQRMALFGRSLNICVRRSGRSSEV